VIFAPYLTIFMNPLKHNALAHMVSFLVSKITQCWSSFLKAKFCHYNDDWFLENGGKNKFKAFNRQISKNFKISHYVFVFNSNGVTNNKKQCLVVFSIHFLFVAKFTVILLRMIAISTRLQKLKKKNTHTHTRTFNCIPQRR
jgi:hypothetical protein